MGATNGFASRYTCELSNRTLTVASEVDDDGTLRVVAAELITNADPTTTRTVEVQLPETELEKLRDHLTKILDKQVK